MRAAATLILSIALSPFARADCAAQSGPTRPHLIELYTSEGCSSCPPADAWLRRLPPDAAIAALAFHVDYWDYLGWRDRFASARYSARQQTQAQHAGARGVYTPQVLLDGRAWDDWYRTPAPTAPVPGIARIALQAESGANLRVHVTTTFDRPSDGARYRNFIALAESGLASEVRAGENRGALLRHDHVVRAFAGPLPLSADTEIALPSDVDAGRATLVAFTQREQDGVVGQVVQLPLGQCH